MRTAFTIATIASIALFARASAAGTCSDSCFSENCDFYVKNWGISCDTAESEYGCSCVGCACEDTEESSSSTLSYSRRTGPGGFEIDTTLPAWEDPEVLLERNTGDESFAGQEERRTGNTTSAPTAAPTNSSNTTSAPTAAPTAAPTTASPTTAPTTASTTIEQAITTTFPAGVTSDTYAAGTGGYKDLCEAAYGVSLGIYTTSTNTWDTDCAVSSAVTSRRADLTILYTATISAAEAAAATTAASSLDAATLNTNAAAVNSAGTLTVATVPTATVVATATVTTSAPTAAPTTTIVGSAPASAGLSFVSIAALALAVKQLL